MNDSEPAAVSRRIVLSNEADYFGRYYYDGYVLNVPLVESALKSHPQANGEMGVIGCCSGGRYPRMFACTSKNVDAAVDSAGGHIIPDDEPTAARPVAAIDMVASLSCPLLALFGEEDANPSPAHAARLREELDKHNKTYEIQTYANAGHAFFADYRPSYRAGPAQDMWRRLLLFYENDLKG